MTTRAAAGGSRFASLHAASARARGDAPDKPKSAITARKPSATTEAFRRRQGEALAEFVVAQRGGTGAAPSATPTTAQPTDAERRAAADASWERAWASVRPNRGAGR